jgi:hypothetical protein
MSSHKRVTLLSFFKSAVVSGERNVDIFCLGLVQRFGVEGRKETARAGWPLDLYALASVCYGQQMEGV